MYVREAGLEYREKELERMNDTPSVHVTREMAFVIARPVYYHVRKTNRMTMPDGSERSRKCYAYNINNVIYKRWIVQIYFCSELNFYL